MRRLLLSVSLAVMGMAVANSYLPPYPQLTSWREYGFKFLPQRVNPADASAQSALGELVSLQADGTLKSLWKRTLLNVPNRILISPTGHVVTLDNWAGRGSPKHALVIYDLKGKVTADLTYDQVMRGQPACQWCQSMDSPFLSWGFAPYRGGKIDFTSYGNEWYVIFRDAKGQGPTISLETGQPKTSWNGKPRP